ncbi:uncharacterized protein LOC115230928 [Octopus sinensis]|uniref:Uncharacterized protein LOC115230928 n=1 Tax=Octopus sinensis TaxID=2607531 RepID=A0A6P7U3N7_9MOLL|nr:uncharacterized protein LOC115230928 [Octopus sinensis]
MPPTKIIPPGLRDRDFKNWPQNSFNEDIVFETDKSPQAVQVKRLVINEDLTDKLLKKFKEVIGIYLQQSYEEGDSFGLSKIDEDQEQTEIAQRVKLMRTLQKLPKQSLQDDSQIENNDFKDSPQNKNQINIVEKECTIGIGYFK